MLVTAHTLTIIQHKPHKTNADVDVDKDTFTIALVFALVFAKRYLLIQVEERVLLLQAKPEGSRAWRGN